MYDFEEHIKNLASL